MRRFFAMGIACALCAVMAMAGCASSSGSSSQSSSSAADASSETLEQLDNEVTSPTPVYSDLVTDQTWADFQEEILKLDLACTMVSGAYDEYPEYQTSEREEAIAETQLLLEKDGNVLRDGISEPAVQDLIVGLQDMMTRLIDLFSDVPTVNFQNEYVEE